MSEAKPFKVCLTGASGYLGSWTLKTCLERGWHVNATTRSIEKHGERLRALVPAATEAGRLTLFEAQLLEADTFKESLAGCDALLHTASPFFGGGESSYDDFIGPAVSGTEGVIRVAKEQGVTKVVVTSSCAAVFVNSGPNDEGLFTEEIWSDIEKMTESKNYYCLSKTLAEKKAWDLEKELGIQVAVMNPPYIFGPLLQPSINTSTGILFKYIMGKTEEISTSGVPFVDVRDVATAHANCIDPTLKGLAWGHRNILVAASAHWSEMVPALKAALPAELQDRCTSKMASGDPEKLSQFVANFDRLEFTPISAVQSMKDTVASLIELKLIPAIE
jgi:cinnamoyl-CoA reductase